MDREVKTDIHIYQELLDVITKYHDDGFTYNRILNCLESVCDVVLRLENEE